MPRIVGVRSWRVRSSAMTALLIVLASVVAVAAAIRSTWSPCGLSMLSTITPIGERGRNHRYASTAAWFILGATLGGATLGLGAAVLAAGVGALRREPGGRARRHRGVRGGHHRVRPERRWVPPAVAHAPGERVVARRVPQLGLRRWLRLADRCGTGHLRHDGGRVPDDRDGRAHRRSARRVRVDDRVRLRARPRRAARAPPHVARAPLRPPSPTGRAAAHRAAGDRPRAGRGARDRGGRRVGARPRRSGSAPLVSSRTVARRPRPATRPGAVVPA